MSEAQPSWIGHTLSGRYKIESLLGSGGMATVYKGFDPNLRRDVAIKLIHSHLAQQPQFVRRFEQEAAAVARLHHPNIVPVHDFNNDQGIYYMVLAYLTGGTLEERLESSQNGGPPLLLSETIDLMITICEAVDYAHQRNIIHRDIKPGNVLFDENNQPYLSDFGIARLAGNQQTMTVVGTPAYMSPEQIRGDQNLDQRSDIYSLGIMLYEMAVGKPPFEGGLGTLILKHMQEPVPDIRLLNSHIPAELVAVIEKALAKNPSDRFQSAAEMALALERVKTSASTNPTVITTTAAPATASSATASSATASSARIPSATTPAQKRPVWVWAVGLLLLVAVAIGGVALSGVLSPEPEAPTPEATSNEPATGNEPTAVPATEPEAPTPETEVATTASCPAGTVLIPDGNFCLHAHEVSNAAYKSCVEVGDCTEPDFTRSITRQEYYGNSEFDEFPVVWVTWEQAVVYCKIEEKRLPTGAEWDQAAQNLAGPSEEEITKFDDTQAVKSASKDVTPEEVYDLAGNVREWVEDSDGIRKIVKGQSFSSNASESDRLLPEITDSAVGFRCAADLR